MRFGLDHSTLFGRAYRETSRIDRISSLTVKISRLSGAVNMHYVENVDTEAYLVVLSIWSALSSKSESRSASKSFEGNATSSKS
jgi:hypothetical protein